jgi:L-ascorbate metabolism protein UlaG (beta-lactamase superfamily)
MDFPVSLEDKMKITFIGHASILIEADGSTILSDPWWRGPCFGAQWWIYPLPFLGALEGVKIDFIYVSHGHHDHFHPATLKTLPRTATVLVSNAIGLAEPIQNLGFPVIALGDDEEHALRSAARVRIMRTRGGDTLMAVSDSRETCVNLNDSLHSGPQYDQEQFIARLRHFYPKIDYVFCGYGVASHFPNCYSIPGKNPELTAARRQAYFNRQWAQIIHGLVPAHAFPFAADVVFLEDDLQWANEPVHNSERPTAAYARLYPGSTVQLHDIAPGFSIESGLVLRERLRGRISMATVSDECRDAMVRANSYGSASPDSVAEVKALLDANIAACCEYLESFAGRYRLLIRFRNGAAAIEILKTGDRIDTMLVPEDGLDERRYDVTYITRLGYLRQSLTTDFGYEILLVGSGGIFRYADPSRVRANLHGELITMMRHHVRAPAARPRGVRRAIRRLKQAVKAVLRRRDGDMYELERWTVFER